MNQPSADQHGMIMDPDPRHAIARTNQEIARFNRRLLIMAAITALIVIALVVFTLVKVLTIADSARESSEQAARQTKVIQGLLERQVANDKERVGVVDRAIAQIAENQRKALAEHDDSVRELLTRTLGLVNQEVNAPANQEFRPGLASAPAPRTAPAPPASAPRTSTQPFGPPTGLQPAPAPTTAPAPAPAPAPTPTPCAQRGKSGKCRK